MAIYRSDQAQFTFAASVGGPPEAGLTALVSSTTGALMGQHEAGATSLSIDGFAPASTIYPSHAASSGVDVRYIIIDSTARIDVQVGTTATTCPSVPEIRRVTRVSGAVVYIDPPLAFPHADNAVIRLVDWPSTTTDAPPVIEGGDTLNSDKMITWFPGVYETVDCPDPEEAFDQRYVLGQNTKRNVYQYFKGQQTYAGAVAGMVLLNGFPLRFPIGRVISVPSATAAVTNCDAVSGNPAVPSEGLIIRKGSVMAKIVCDASNATTHLVAGRVIAIGGTVATTTILPIVGANAPGNTSVQEIRRIVQAGSGANNTFIRLNYPVNFDHDVTSTTVEGGKASGVVRQVADGATYYHYIYEDVKLPNVAWNVNVKDDLGQNAFQRRYHGGKIDGLTLSAEAGGLITCDWDSATFLGINHNLFADSKLTPTEHLRGYLPMHDIAKTDIGTPVMNATADTMDALDGRTLPSTEPYYFSEGEILLNGVVIGRLQNFSLNVSNSVEPKYYIEDRGGDNRGPKELFEGQRSYTMTATVGLPDSSDFLSISNHSLFAELLQAGDHPTSSNFINMEGVKIEIVFTRNNANTDEIRITIPGDGTVGQGGQNQGALISAAPINVDGSNPMEQSAQFMFSNMQIVVRDSEHFYP